MERTALALYDQLPPAFKYGRTFFEWMSFLRESDYWHEQRIVDYQYEQIKRLLRHCIKNVPYYRALFPDYGLNPDKLQSVDDIRVLPYLDKETVRDRSNEFIDTTPRGKLVSKSTSGSTGIPLTVYMTREAVDIYHAFLFHSFNRIGYDPRRRMVKFWNRLSLHNRTNLPFIKIGNKLILSKRHLTEDWLARYAEMIAKFRPDFITGYPSTLSILASHIKANNCPIEQSPKAVVVHGETVHDWQRSLIEEVFTTRVFSVYSLTEGALFGSECEFTSCQHFYPQSGFVEFTECGKGQQEIVATGFTNHAMPFIRYRTNDAAFQRQNYCEKCGRHHLLAGRITGRINDFLINKHEQIIPRLLPLIEIFPHTRQYQFFQEEPGRAILRIVKMETYSDEDATYIRTKLREMLGLMKDTIDIAIEYVDHIPSNPAGKFNLVDQKLDMRNYLS